MEKTKERAPAKGDAVEGEAPQGIGVGHGGQSIEGATRVHASPTRCPWCHDGCEPEDTSAVVCQRCLSRHHPGCWREGGRCASCEGTTALGAIVAPREVAPAELALFKTNRVREAVQRIAKRLAIPEAEASLVLLEAAAREASVHDGQPLGPAARTMITLSAIFAAMIVAIVFINVAIG